MTILFKESCVNGMRAVVMDGKDFFNSAVLITRNRHICILVNYYTYRTINKPNLYNKKQPHVRIVT